MYKNNFDCSSTGLNIEVSACYDSSMSSVIFNDCYVVIERRWHTRSLLVRTWDFDCKCPEKVSEVGWFATGKRGRISKKDMCEILNDCSEYCHEESDYTWKELMDEINNIDISCLPELLESHSHLYHLNKDLALYGSSGYCQGDFEYVLCKTETAKNYWTEIDHELWDCPVSARVTISGCEYDYYDFDCQQYSWEKEKFVDGVVKAHTNNLELQERLKKQLMAMLPNELEVV